MNKIASKKFFQITTIAILVLSCFMSLAALATVAETELVEQSELAVALDLTSNELNFLDTTVREYFSEKYPFLLEWKDFPIYYGRVRELEDQSGVKVIKAEGRFELPSPTVTFRLYDGKVELVSEEIEIQMKEMQPLQAVEHRDVEIDGDLNPEFIIHWRYSDFPNNARADEVVDLVETAARTSWSTICGNGAGQWDFDEPLDDDGTIDIYINDNVHAWGPPGIEKKSTMWVSNGTDDFIFIHHNRQQTWKDDYKVEWPAEQDCFTAGISHEFFHGVQRGYSVITTRYWIVEGTARFIPSAVNPNAAFYTPQSSNKRSLYIRNAVKYLQAPEATLSGKSYDACVYWRYIHEHHGGIATVKDIFEQIETGNPLTFEEELNCLNTVLQPSITVQNSFTNFSCANYLEFSSNPFARDNDFYEHSTCYYENVKLVGDKTWEYNGKDLKIDKIWWVIDVTKAESYATNYIEFVSKEKENNDVQVVFSGDEDTTFVKKIIVYNSTYPQGKVVDFTDDKIIIPYPKNYDKIAIVVINTGHTGNGNYWVLLRPIKDVDTVLDTDRSGSMSGQKMIDAKNAAITFVNLLEKPSGWWIFKTDRDKVGLVSFSSSATLDLHLTSKFEDAITVINGYSAGGSTNMGDALSKSINELKTNGRDTTIWSIIYLTDGKTNTGLTREEILNLVSEEAVKNGISIYTLGYGTGSDEDFLRQVADVGNGKYYFAPDSARLKELYIEISHATKGWEKLMSFMGTVSQGETKTVGILNVQPENSLIKILLIWPGSDLDLIVIDPNGTAIEPGMSGVIYSGNDALPEYYEVYDPEPGDWTIQVYGKDTTGATEDYNVMVFQPGALMQVNPTKWDVNYPLDRTMTFNVSEIAGNVNLTNITFTASDLTETIATSAVKSLMKSQAEAEARGEAPIATLTKEAYAQNTNVILADCFSFTPNDFSVPAGGSKNVEATLALPSNSIPSGTYSGTINVSSDGGNSTIFVTVTVASVETATGIGTAYFASDSGIIEDLTALNESDLPEENPNVDFPHGLFSFNITGLSNGETVNVTIDFPEDIPTTAEYWKYNTSSGEWYQIPIGSNDGDNIITITLQDGGIGDNDGVENGIISDPGAPGVPSAPPSAASATSTGAPKDAYRVHHNVYATGSGFAPGTNVDIYVVPDQDWDDDDPIPSDVTASVETVLVGTGGVVGPVLVWHARLVPGPYDIVIDADRDGFYNAATDGLDNGSPGFVVLASPPPTPPTDVPILTPHGIIALVGLLCVVGASRIRKGFN